MQKSRRHSHEEHKGCSLFGPWTNSKGPADRQTDSIQRRASEHSKNQDRCVSGWLDGWLNGGPHKANSQCLSVLVGMECNNLNRFQLDLYESFQALLLLLLPDSAGGWLAVCVCSSNNPQGQSNQKKGVYIKQNRL